MANQSLIVPEHVAQQQQAMEAQRVLLQQPRSFLDPFNPLDIGVTGITLLSDQVIIKYKTKKDYNGILLVEKAKAETEHELTVGTIVEVGVGEYIDKYDLAVGDKVIAGQFTGVLLEGIYGDGEVEEEGQKYFVYYRLVGAKYLLGIPRYNEIVGEEKEDAPTKESSVLN